MGLLSIFKRQVDSVSTPSAVSGPADAVQQARARARRRLIGAAVLVLIGVVGFPIVFETQPRPIPVDIPIELPRKEGVAPLVMPVARAPAVVAAPSEVITESREEAERGLASPMAESSASAPATPLRSVPKPVVSVTAAAPVALPKPVAETKPAVKNKDSARARSLLEGKPDAAADSGRFVVQVGAFADASAAHDTRVKVEKLGLKTYTQVASTPAGNRIRVRVGPFGTRDEADKALAKARGAGLTAVVLTL